MFYGISSSLLTSVRQLKRKTSNVTELWIFKEYFHHHQNMAFMKILRKIRKLLCDLILLYSIPQRDGYSLLHWDLSLIWIWYNTKLLSWIHSNYLLKSNWDKYSFVSCKLLKHWRTLQNLKVKWKLFDARIKAQFISESPILNPHYIPEQF